MPINAGMMSSNTDEWATPINFFNMLNTEFNFTLDPCSNNENAKCYKHYTREDDGLSQNWNKERVFCNPPYGKDIINWVKKCHDEAVLGALCVMLIPARTDTRYFHEYILNNAEIRFIKGRLKFGDATNAAPFPSMVVVFRPYLQKLMCPISYIYYDDSFEKSIWK